MAGTVVKLALGAVPGRVLDRLRTLPVVAPALRRALVLATRPLHGRPMAVAHGPAAGVRLWFDDCSAVWMSGRTERAVQEAIARFARPGSVAFDIGANVGFFTLLASRLVGPSGWVVAFEPHPANVARLRRNVALNELANVVVVAGAVSAASAERLLDGRHPATASLVPAGGAARPGQVPVTATSIDDFLAARPDLTPGVIKIDAEGHEAAIIRGMRATLRRCGPILICEVHGRGGGLSAILAEAGYRAIPLPAGGRRGWSSHHLLAAPRGDPALRPAAPAIR